MSAPIRVWLEPGYDHGRVGAWMLDLPGCFCWGTTEQEALARVAGAVHRYLDRLEAQGEPVEPRPDTDEVQVVERVAPSWIADGDGSYERNATFSPDQRPVTSDQLERTVVRLRAAHADVLAAVRRLEQHEARHGRLRVEEEDPTTLPAGPRRQRSPGSLLRHIAGAQMWLASRLDRTERYAGVGPEEPARYLDETNQWAIERLRHLHAADPGLAAEDGKGETWTLAKVCRRLVYHVHDHLDELERRLDRAEGVGDRLQVRRERPRPDTLAHLLRRTGFGSRAADPDRLARLIEGSTETWTAWDGDALVAFARVLSDGAFNAYVLTVAVDPQWQGRGAGRRLMEALTAGRAELSFVLGARSGVEGFYRDLGFEAAPWMMARRRSR